MEFERSAERELARLDREAVRRILGVLRDRVSPLDDPRAIGEALKGSRLGNFWKHRIGDFRVIAAIEDDALRILVIKIGHHRDVYR
ncbi:type II toxin-antitoxin system RelE/ParE family toxin [Methylobacterium sp. J-078]|uniref:type II toxin-antitoxin system RelE family toxin n=1 Tax=Methylobacterium sp. J-078 TaxID=2836657 RepID=UPI001FBA2349|nr:type II toxin-antitoxin system RelE/ParE family toxin [Methylobacterium sp. J-078]MCJ2046293.1 type II toxin-antitoxin system RelE/ParE family toxin [Methylobacterium sp. J-078]